MALRSQGGGCKVAIGCLLLAYQMALWWLWTAFAWLYQDHGFSRRDCLSVRNQDSMPPVQVSRGTLAAIFRRFRIDTASVFKQNPAQCRTE